MNPSHQACKKLFFSGCLVKVLGWTLDIRSRLSLSNLKGKMYIYDLLHLLFKARAEHSQVHFSIFVFFFFGQKDTLTEKLRQNKIPRALPGNTDPIVISHHKLT